MRKTTPLIINVFKDCGTCTHLCHFEVDIGEPEIAKCELSDEIVTKAKDNGSDIEYIDIDCKEWAFDKRLLDDSYYFVELETSPVENK